MKTFASKEKRSAPTTRKARPYVHYPMGPAQQAQQAEICRILRSTGAQAKLTIGQPNDKYEQEADRVADQVMAMPEPKLQCQPEGEEEEETLQTKPLADQITPLVQRQEEPPEEEEEILQGKMRTGGAGEVGSDSTAHISNLRGGGQQLPKSERLFFEARIGHNFSGVRVHADNHAAKAAGSINARAFTAGRDVVFGRGEYAPGTTDGRRLLAHELTHLVQQDAAGVKLQRQPENEQSYTVKTGESIREIAEKFNVTQAALMMANADKVQIWTTSSGRKIRGFNAEETIVIPAEKALSGEESGEKGVWDYVSGLSAIIGSAITGAWDWLTGLRQEGGGNTGEETEDVAPTWAACVMPGPTKGGAGKKTNMDASFVGKIDNVCGRMKAKGYNTKMFWGYRTEAEQVHIATAGRTFKQFTTFMNSEATKGHITAAGAQGYIDYYDPDKGGNAMRDDANKATWTLKSMHRQGKAADVVHPTALWNPPEGEVYWSSLKTSAEDEGLRIGPPASDKAHVQVT